MKTNALSLANYLIGVSKKHNVDLRQFGLMKRVYITHGFCLAIYNMSALDERFDVVEAWDNGPVIPSVYHTFKYNRDNPIKDEAVIADYKGESDISYIVPELEDERIKKVADAVWKRYEGVPDFKLIRLTHAKGTPWSLCYEKGVNRIIPDSYTKTYYSKLVEYEMDRQEY